MVEGRRRKDESVASKIRSDLSVRISCDASSSSRWCCVVTECGKYSECEEKGVDVE